MEDKYKIVIEALAWEAKHRQNSEIIDGKRYFLPETNHLDEDFEEALRVIKNRKTNVLDIGCGKGIQAIELGKTGLSVTGIDVSKTAIREANVLAKKEKVNIDFKMDNILKPRLNFEFDIIIDRGCFTLIPNKFKKLYTRNILVLLKSKGYFLLKVDFKIGDKIVKNNFLSAFNLMEAKESIYPSEERKKIKAMFYIFQKTK